MQTRPKVGIESISVHVPRYFVDLKTLAAANGVDPDKYYHGLGGRRMAVVAPDEDPVTMAVEAARALIERNDLAAGRIGLLVVGTESGVDGAKPIAAYVHGLLGLSGECRTFDAKHACYSGTAALRMAADWCIVHGGQPRNKALVIATDIARYDEGSAGEPTQGAGAVAMLVGDRPHALELDLHHEAVFSREVMDFWRPNYRASALVDGKTSISSYLCALENTYRAHRAASGLSWDDYEYLLFHVPFPKMALKAFRVLYGLERDGKADEEFDLRSGPALWANRELGNIYSGSLYLSLASLLERGERRVEGARIGLFSYGSGCCAEFFSGRLGLDSKKWAEKIGIGAGLARRTELSYEQYRAFRKNGNAMACDGSYLGDPQGAAFGRLRKVFYCGIRDHRRLYFVNEAEVVRHPGTERRLRRSSVAV
ncbi:MAG TPA: hydroxymethylglutaryl-CoA synthase [Myxococcota bacterium]|nr:hydroxymethylglutaryl-CoA synthase [Myxococcota bacterium]